MSAVSPPHRSRAGEHEIVGGKKTLQPIAQKNIQLPRHPLSRVRTFGPVSEGCLPAPAEKHTLGTEGSHRLFLSHINCPAERSPRRLRRHYPRPEPPPTGRGRHDKGVTRLTPPFYPAPSWDSSEYPRQRCGNKFAEGPLISPSVRN